jgi:molecular chaperone DnaK (HSP70)
MSEPQYAVGIDLGTTHCAIAYARLARPSVRLLSVPQLIAPGEVAERPLLPSFLYLPGQGELAEAERALPWGTPPHVVGELARRLGATVPSRLVASAKSWVCHGGVNRRAAILPWSAPDDAPHVSPFDAQVAYLAHLRAAWDAAHPGAPLVAQDVVVAVPASFDEAARELTTQAADAAGLGSLRLLEEPQAAFYDFLGEHDDALDESLGDAKLILVVDVGGGTTDLTLLRVLPQSSPHRIERIAVGGHLMLGGDNMDAALAMHALEKSGLERPRDATVWSALVQSARQAKERLLGADAPSSVVLTYQSRGSRLLGVTKSLPLTREDASQVLLDGFLPRTGRAEVGERTARSGLTTLGLPYTSDVAIGRHICGFLRRHASAAREAGAAVDDGLPRPDLLLLNGGVFNAPALIERLSEVLAGWYGRPVPRLPHTSLDTAVANGAARAVLARRGIGAVIGGGAARAYYIGVEGRDGRPAALCLAPRGMDEGATVEVRDRLFDLVLNQRVAFPLYAYTGDRIDAPGTLVDVDTDELDAIAPLETVLRNRERAVTSRESQSGTVPVTLKATLSEAGALELYLVTLALPPRRWKLEFALAAPKERATQASAPPEAPAKLPQPAPEIHKARAALRRAFVGDDPKGAKGVRSEIEKLLGPRGEWSAATCRALWKSCMELSAERGRSEEHELAWLRLCGWCLRPGFGAPGDEGRVDRLFEVHDRGLARASRATWVEWWILWRRIAPGLDAARQLALYDDVRPWLFGGAPASGPRAYGPVEMMQLLAVLERLPIDAKIKAGELLLAQTKRLGSYWPLGRAGARSLLRGDPRQVVPPGVVERWLTHILALDWAKADGAAFAAASIARSTGDPARDVDAALRRQVADRLAHAKAPASWIDQVLRPSDLAEGDMKRVLGESVPAGLRLA